ncbi:MAG TPA: dipeptide epimerase [Anaerolineaceae bacterium]|nr:dipeptide epimerase [Anaerolineaceae bacterium]
MNDAYLSWQMLTLRLRNPFRLSYGTSETRTAFWLRLAGDAGWGEGTIPPYYGVSHEAMIAYWQQVAADARPLPDDPAEIADWVGTSGPAPARSGLELALYDRIARRQGVPLYRLLGLPRPEPLPTSFTIAIDTPERMAEMALDIEDMPVIKLKLGSDEQDLDRVAAVRAARPDAKLRIDANAGWTVEEALRFTRALEPYDLEMIEQPLGRDEFAGMGRVQAETDIPVVADESVQSLADVEALARAGVRGINLKLMKVGGLSKGLLILERARELGLSVLLGCMIETSIGVTAMAHLTGLADWVDLDSPLLINNDPFDGITYDADACVHVPERPGIGATLRPGAELS